MKRLIAITIAVAALSFGGYAVSSSSNPLHSTATTLTSEPTGVITNQESKPMEVTPPQATPEPAAVDLPTEPVTVDPAPRTVTPPAPEPTVEVEAPIEPAPSGQLHDPNASSATTVSY